jgi:putative amide transporter protein
MLAGLILFYVGAVLILNGLWMLGRIADREIFVINLLVGLLALRVAHEYAFGPGANAQSMRDAALTLLFAFTYLWNAYNRVVATDGRGLGWFSLFVAVNALAVGLGLALEANDLWSTLDAMSWIAWAGLWLLFFLLLVCRKPWQRFTGWMAIAQGVLTGFLPGYLLLGI